MEDVQKKPAEQTAATKSQPPNVGKNDSWASRDLEELREYVNYSILTQWRVRWRDADNLANALKEWVEKKHFLSGILPEQHQQQHGRIAIECCSRDCDCKCCHAKQRYLEQVDTFYESVANVKKSAPAPSDKKSTNGSEESQLPQMGMSTSNNETTPSTLLETDLVEVVKKEYAEVLNLCSNVEYETRLQYFVRRKKEIAEKEAILAEKEASFVYYNALHLANTIDQVLSAHDHVFHHIGGCTNYGHIGIHSFNYSAALLIDPKRVSTKAGDPQLPTSIFGPDPSDTAEVLKKFHMALSQGLRKAFLLPKTCKDFKAEMKKTCSLISLWDENKNGGEFKRKFCVPGATVRGRDGCCSLLGSIMYRLASMSSSNQTDTRKPISNRSLHSLYVAPSLPIRFLGFDVECVEECFRANLPYSSFILVEIKNVFPRNRSIASLHEEGARQVVRHLADKIFHYFNLCGIGQNHRCRGAVLTMVSIEIVELALTGVGTKCFQLSLNRTHPHFLYDAQTTRHLLNLDEDDTLPKFLFDDSRPYHGFAMLASALNTPSDQSSPMGDGQLTFREDESSEEKRLTDLLAHGSFYCAYRLDTGKMNDSLFVKIPQCSAGLADLENEKDVLRELHHPCIPKVSASKLGIVSYRRYCEQAEMSGLLLSGHVGAPAFRYETFSGQQLTIIADKVLSALEHAHSKKYIHLDVSPWSICVAASGTSSLDVQLMDWGFSRKQDDSVENFYGIVTFTHDEILHPSKDDTSACTPKPKHDLASLAYTIAALCSGSGITNPWPELTKVNITDDTLESRRLKSNDLLTKSSIDPIVKDKLLAFLSLDSNNDRKRPPVSQTATKTQKKNKSK